MENWGYRENEDFYTKRHLCSAIDRYMAMGASYLLNVGPDAMGGIPPQYEKSLSKVADWYNRMEECLESADSDAFDYEIRYNDYIATVKNGKTYLHFYNGIISNSIAINKYPNEPKNIRLLNNGISLSWDIIPLPEFFDAKLCSIVNKSLHIRDIPADEYSDEPIVIEISWQ